ARHLGDGGVRQIALSLEDPAAQDHLAETPHIAGRGEQAARGHRLPFAIAEWILELRDRDLLKVSLRRVRPIRLRQPGELLLVGPESRVLHAERREQALL